MKYDKNRFYPESEELKDFQAEIDKKKSELDMERGIDSTNESIDVDGVINGGVNAAIGVNKAINDPNPLGKVSGAIQGYKGSQELKKSLNAKPEAKGEAKESVTSTVGAMKPVVAPGKEDILSKSPMNDNGDGFGGQGIRGLSTKEIKVNPPKITKPANFQESKKDVESSKLRERKDLYKIYYRDLLDYKRSKKIKSITAFLLYPEKATPKDILKLASAKFLKDSFKDQKDVKNIIKKNGSVPFCGSLNLVNDSANTKTACFYNPKENVFYIKKGGNLLTDADFSHPMKPTEFAGYWKKKYFYNIELNAALKDVYEKKSFFKSKKKVDALPNSVTESIADFIITPNNERGDLELTSKMITFSEAALADEFPELSKDTKLFMVEKACNRIKYALMQEHEMPDTDLRSVQSTGIAIERSLRESSSYDSYSVKEAQPVLNRILLEMVTDHQQKILDNYFENYVTEAAEISDRMKPIIAQLNQKGYKTKYSSPGYAKERKKSDRDRDGVYYNKMYTTGRIMFDDHYNLPPAPKHWVSRVVDNKSYLDVVPTKYDPKYGNVDQAWGAWKEKYMGSLERWVDDLPERSQTGDNIDQETNNPKKKILESASTPIGAIEVLRNMRSYNLNESDMDDIRNRCDGILAYHRYVEECAFKDDGIDEVDVAFYTENVLEKLGISKKLEDITETYPELKKYSATFQEVDTAVRNNINMGTPTTEEKVLSAFESLIGVLEMLASAFGGGMAAGAAMGINQNPGGAIMTGIKNKSGALVGKGVFGAVCALVATLVLQLTVFKFVNKKLSIAQIDAAIRRIEKIEMDDPSKEAQCDKLIEKLKNAKEVIVTKKYQDPSALDSEETDSLSEECASIVESICDFY